MSLEEAHICLIMQEMWRVNGVKVESVLGGGRGVCTYKIFWSSLEDVDLFACICLSACLLEYLWALSSAFVVLHFLSLEEPTIAFRFVFDR